MTILSDIFWYFDIDSIKKEKFTEIKNDILIEIIYILVH